MPRLRFHDLRHTSATLLLAAGLPIHMVAERLGHSNPGLVLSTYGHVIPTQRQDAADAMDKVLGG